MPGASTISAGTSTAGVPRCRRQQPPQPQRYAQPARGLARPCNSATVCGAFALGYLRVLIDQLKDREQREWYLCAAVEYGWGRNVLELQIKSGFREREGKAITNFHFQPPFPPPDSDLAEQVLRDPYNFDFLTDTREAKDGEIERGLLIHLRDLLLELGRGFAFVGSQVPLEVGGEDFKLDLLFYHLKLRCFCVIDLLCGRPHNSSSVAQCVMWRWDHPPAILGWHTAANAT